MEQALNSHDFPPLFNPHGLATGLSSDSSNRSPVDPSSLTANRPPTDLASLTLPSANPQGNGASLLIHGSSQAMKAMVQPPVSPILANKTFLLVFTGEKRPLIPPSRNPLRYKDKTVARFLKMRSKLFHCQSNTQSLENFPRCLAYRRFDKPSLVLA